MTMEYFEFDGRPFINLGKQLRKVGKKRLVAKGWRHNSLLLRVEIDGVVYVEVVAYRTGNSWTLGRETYHQNGKTGPTPEKRGAPAMWSLWSAVAQSTLTHVHDCAVEIALAQTATRDALRGTSCTI